MLQKNHAIEDIATLKARCGYMFSKPLLSEDFFKGWFPIFTGLCIEIDRVLGEQRARFRWLQIKEKFGVPRMHFHLEGVPDPLWKTLQELVSQAQRESARRCMVCGEPAHLSQKSAWLVTVCDVHEPDEVSKRGGWSLGELMEVPKSKEGQK
ncbi:MAG: hypothetical protein I8H91_02790 [Burkholderiales bacterium]|nr:hypothetical protein [Burkholderiales bacterium]